VAQLYVDDQFQRPATANGTVTGPATDTPVQTDPFSFPSTGLNYQLVGALNAFINSTHQLVCQPAGNFTSDGVYAPTEENLRDQAAKITFANMAANSIVRLRVSADGKTCYQYSRAGQAQGTIQKIVNDAATNLTAEATAVTGYATSPCVAHSEAIGANPTTIRAWLADPATPDTPIAGTLLTTTDSDPALQGPGRIGVASNTPAIRWRRYNLTTAPLIAVPMLQIEGTTNSCKFQVPSVTLGVPPYSYAWDSAVPADFPTWVPVPGANVAQPNFTGITDPTLFRLTVSDVNGATGVAYMVGAPWKDPVKGVFTGDSITVNAGYSRAAYNVAGFPDGSGSQPTDQMMEAMQQGFGPRNMTILGFGVGSTYSTQWRPDAAPFGGEATNLYTQLKHVMTQAGFGAGDFVDMMIGMNDGENTEPEVFQANMQAFADGIHADFPGVEVIFERPTSTGVKLGFSADFNRPLYLKRFGDAMANIAANTTHVFCSTTASFDLFIRRADELQDDGVHPNGTVPSQQLNLTRYRTIANVLDGLLSGVNPANYTNPGAANVIAPVSYKYNGATIVGTHVDTGVDPAGYTNPGATNVVAPTSYKYAGATIVGTHTDTGVNPANYSDPGAANVIAPVSYKYNGATIVGTHVDSGGTGGGMTIADLRSELDTRGLTEDFTIDATDKTGYKLAPDGLNYIDTTEPTVANNGPFSEWNFAQKMKWLVMRYGRVNRTPNSVVVKTTAGAQSTTQTISDNQAGTEATGALT
jgi:lysophospholipase L1-like esterase